MKNIMKLVISGMMMLALTACGSSAQKTDENKKLEAGMGEALSTMFFDITLNDADLKDSINEVLSGKETTFLLADVTIKNTTGNAIEMADSDFWAKWGEGDRDYDAPITAYGEEVGLEDALPSRFTLNAGEEKTGKLIFVVPSDKTSFQLMTEDYYSEGNGQPKTGDTYTISFTIE